MAWWRWLIIWQPKWKFLIYRLEYTSIHVDWLLIDYKPTTTVHYFQDCCHLQDQTRKTARWNSWVQTVYCGLSGDDDDDYDDGGGGEHGDSDHNHVGGSVGSNDDDKHTITMALPSAPCGCNTSSVTIATELGLEDWVTYTVEGSNLPEFVNTCCCANNRPITSCSVELIGWPAIWLTATGAISLASIKRGLSKQLLIFSFVNQI